MSQILTQPSLRRNFELKPLDEVQAAERKRAAREREEQERRDRIAQQSRALTSRVGKRYSQCSIEGFEISSDRHEAARQRAVLSKIAAYRDSVASAIDAGENLVLCGKKGTGKDHLLSVLMFAAIQEGKTVQFWSGVDLWASIRDAIDSAKSEKTWLAEILAPDVLAISDPLPPIGSLTDFQSACFFRIVDARYRAMKSVWVTTNSGGEDAETRAGSQAIDRLRDGSLSVTFDWKSHRKSKN